MSENKKRYYNLYTVVSVESELPDDELPVQITKNVIDWLNEHNYEANEIEVSTYDSKENTYIRSDKVEALLDLIKNKLSSVAEGSGCNNTSEYLKSLINSLTLKI